jgi:RNA polymerase sigma-70 factor (ECF subfamily)
VSLSDYDRILLDRCLQRAPRAWEDFVDRFLGLVIHVASHTATARGLRIDAADRDDLVADVFVKLLENDFKILRRFRRQCSLATYLAVVSRRVILRRLNSDQRFREMAIAIEPVDNTSSGLDHESRIDDRDHVEQLLTRLDGAEAQVVRMYHLEGRSYREISSVTGLAENSIGPVLSRAREHLRRNGQ